MDQNEKIKLFGKEFNVLIWKGYKHRETYTCNFTRNKEGCLLLPIKQTIWFPEWAIFSERALVFTIWLGYELDAVEKIKRCFNDREEIHKKWQAISSHFSDDWPKILQYMRTHDTFDFDAVRVKDPSVIDLDEMMGGGPADVPTPQQPDAASAPDIKSQSPGKDESNGDGDSFNTVEIGDQVWMVENLRVDRFRNGDPIPEARSKAEFRQFGVRKEPAWHHCNFNEADGGKFGKVYNWYAVHDERGLAPEGCVVPIDQHWYDLMEFLGGADEAGAHMKYTEQLAESFYESTDVSHGTNESGWRGMFHDPDDARVKWWSATPRSEYDDDSDLATSFGLALDSSWLIEDQDMDKHEGCFVRCLRAYEDAAAPGPMDGDFDEEGRPLNDNWMLRQMTSAGGEQDDEDDDEEEDEEESEVQGEYLFDNPVELVTYIQSTRFYFAVLDKSEELMKMWDTMLNQLVLQVIIPRTGQEVIRHAHLEGGIPVDPLCRQAQLRAEKAYDKDYDTHREYVCDMELFIHSMTDLTDHPLRLSILKFFFDVGQQLNPENARNGVLSLQDRFFVAFLAIRIWPDMDAKGIDQNYFKAAGLTRYMSTTEKYALLIYDFMIFIDDEDSGSNPLAMVPEDLKTARKLIRELTGDKEAETLIGDFKENWTADMFKFYHIGGMHEAFHDMCVGIWRELRKEAGPEKCKKILKAFENDFASEHRRSVPYLPEYKTNWK